MTLHLERVPAPEVPWAELDARPGRTVFQTRGWADFLVESQGAEPVTARLHDGPSTLGWFSGAAVRRAGLRILGSPLRGWTTSYMGFTLTEPVDPAPLLEALSRFAFGDLSCLHLEVMDRSWEGGVARPAGFRAGRLAGFEVAIDRTDEELLAAMKKHGRRDVRRAVRNGVTVEEVDPGLDPGFAAEYYGQVEQSFAKRGLVPTYPRERVEAAIRHLWPAGHLLLLRARDPGGRPAATGVFPGLPGATAVFWMGASERSLQPLLPNEALMGEALRRWRDRGARRFDFGGGGSYKAKYGGEPITVPWLRRSRYPALEHGRELARRVARRAQVRAGRQ